MTVREVMYMGATTGINAMECHLYGRVERMSKGYHQAQQRFGSSFSTTVAYWSSKE
jgi:hypothetical protein